MQHSILILPKCQHIINSIFLIFMIFLLLFPNGSQKYKISSSIIWNNWHRIKFLLRQKETNSALVYTQGWSKLNGIICNIHNKNIISDYEKEINKSNNQRISIIDSNKLNLLYELIKSDKKIKNTRECN